MCVTPEEPLIVRRIAKLKPKQFLSRDDVKKRTEQGDVLVIIYNKVYQLNNWLKHHPGGALAIKHMAGKEGERVKPLMPFSAHRSSLPLSFIFILQARMQLMQCWLSIQLGPWKRLNLFTLVI